MNKLRSEKIEIVNLKILKNLRLCYKDIKVEVIVY